MYYRTSTQSADAANCAAQSFRGSRAEAFTPQAPAISVSMGFPPAAAGAGGVCSPSMS